MVLLAFASADIGPARGEEKPDSQVSAVRGFDDLVRRSVHFWSDGTRLAGDLTYPADFSADQKYPCIVMCHGWGGVKSHLNAQIGPRFAKAGYVVFTFDYRGWGASNSRLVVDGDLPKPDADGKVSVTARAFRQIVDPRDQQEDIDAAISFVEGEPMVDAERIGLWGSSFGGGHVIWRAARDSRVKCVVAQVGGMDADASVATADGLEMVRQDKIKRARGQLSPFPRDDEAEKPAGLVGTPFYAKFRDFIPADDAKNIKVPTLIIDAELEHYFDNKNNGHKAYLNIQGNAPVEYHELKGKKHYDVYTEPTLTDVMALEIPWFDKYLK